MVLEVNADQTRLLLTSKAYEVKFDVPYTVFAEFTIVDLCNPTPCMAKQRTDPGPTNFTEVRHVAPNITQVLK